jgi:hypothetical protein
MSEQPPPPIQNDESASNKTGLFKLLEVIFGEGKIGGIWRPLLALAVILLGLSTFVLTPLSSQNQLIGLVIIFLGLPVLLLLFASLSNRRSSPNAERGVVPLTITVYTNGEITNWVPGAEVRVGGLDDAFQGTTKKDGRVRFSYSAKHANQPVMIVASKEGVGRGRLEYRLAGADAFVNIELKPDAAVLPKPAPGPVSAPAQASGKQRIFISYKRDTQPDANLALQLYEALGSKYDVFIDQQMLVGELWVKRIEEELRRAHFLLVLLSEKSIQSEMVLHEIEQAYELNAQQQRLKILPVRVAYDKAFEYKLGLYLNPLNWAMWQHDSDTPSLIETLTQAIEGGALPIGEAQKARLITPRRPVTGQLQAPTPYAQLEDPTGTMDISSPFFVARARDQQALAFAKQPRITLVIKGPRQVGKSSLLVRIAANARETGKQVVLFDFQGILDIESMQNQQRFYRNFCMKITRELRLPVKVEDTWDSDQSQNMMCTNYFEDTILPTLENSGQRLLLALDEVERMFRVPFSTDFFGMLRSWHNMRSHRPIWKQLDLVLVTSTEPYLFIEDKDMSPFNVGEVLTLEDFTFEELESLNGLHKSPFGTDDLQRLHHLLGGHPYLTRRAMYLVVSQQITIAQLFKTAVNWDGPFRDHLRSQIFDLSQRPELRHALKEILETGDCSDKKILHRLSGAGLVRINAQDVSLRCELYASYLKEQGYV